MTLLESLIMKGPGQREWQLKQTGRVDLLLGSNSTHLEIFPPGLAYLICPTTHKICKVTPQSLQV